MSFFRKKMCFFTKTGVTHPDFWLATKKDAEIFLLVFCLVYVFLNYEIFYQFS